MRLLSICLFFLTVATVASAQYKLQGTVYDSSRTYPVEAVSVLSTSGRGAVTNAAGAYTLEVSNRDSVWFSYLGKPTVKFAVATIRDLTQFDLSLKVPVKTLAEIRLKPRDYRQDSIQNRLDYAKAFDFQRPNLSTMTSINSTGAGIDINELIRVFQFRKNRSTAAFQKRLIQQEQDKYIDYKFNKGLVRRLTELSGEELDTFMIAYRPPYELVLYASDYDFQAYIKESYREFRSRKGF